MNIQKITSIKQHIYTKDFVSREKIAQRKTPQRTLNTKIKDRDFSSAIKSSMRNMENVLSCLNLSFKNTIENKIMVLCDSLKFQTSLKKISITFGSKERNFDFSKNIIKTLKELKLLTSLSIDLTRCSITDSEIKALSSNFKNLGKLKDFSLILIQNDELTDDGIKFLCNNLKCLERLNDLSLEIVLGRNITRNGVKYLNDTFKHFERLNSLYIDFLCSHGVADMGILSLSNLKCLKELTKLSMNLAFLKITDMGIEILCNYIKPLKKISNLSLNISNCSDITTNGYKTLNKICCRLDNIKKLLLDFSENPNVTDEVIKDLSNNLKYLKELKDFSLYLGDSCLTDSGLNFLSSRLKKIEKLTHLDLLIVGCHEITNSGIIILSGDLYSCENLINLKLQINHNSQVKKEAFKILFDYLNVFKSLRSLTVIIYSCELKGMGELRFNENLENLSLDFQDSEMTKLERHRLIEKARSLARLKNLYLDLDGHERITLQDMPQYKK